MKDSPSGSNTQHIRTQKPELVDCDNNGNYCYTKTVGIKNASHSVLDHTRQANRLPIKILKMLTAHTSHLLHPEYLQPLTSAPVSIELDAKKSPLALLAQTCSQIGKPDPPSSSKLGSANGLGDKDSNGRSSSGLKQGEHRPTLEDKSSFKPYSKGGEGRREALGSTGNSDKSGFRVPSSGGANSSTAMCPSFAQRALSPISRAGSPPPLTPAQPLRQNQSPGPGSQQPPLSHSRNGEPKGAGPEPGASDVGGALKKETEQSKGSSEGPQLANSCHARASANSSSGSCESSPRPEGKAEPQPGHIAPISPYKSGHSVFPLSSSGIGYHGSIVGAYAGYPSQFVPALDHKSTLGGVGVGVPGKHPSSSPLTGASPPSFMQGLCRDPYCLSYPNAPHLGGSGCSSCVHDPSVGLKSGFPLVYPPQPLHSLHPSSLSSGGMSSMSHPLYTYGFMLPSEPQPHSCNWVSAGGPCDKRFSSSEELLSHLRTHTALPGVDGKLLSYPPVSSAASCHLHLPPQNSAASLQNSFSLRAPHSLGLGRYHPYSKVHLPAGPSLPMHSLQGSAPYYSHYALYSQRLGSASALGYQ